MYHSMQEHVKKKHLEGGEFFTLNLSWNEAGPGGRSGSAPKLGMRSGECHSYLVQLHVSGTDIHDLAHLLPLRHFVEEQKLLSLRYISVQQEKSAMHTHVDRASVFVKRASVEGVPIDAYKYLELPPRTASPVTLFRRHSARMVQDAALGVLHGESPRRYYFV
jgi:hypothetical protein